MMGLRHGRIGRAGPVALVCLSGWLVSCGAMNGLQGSRAVPASARIEVIDNFGASDLEQKFEAVAKNVSTSVVAISATEAAMDAESNLRADDINPDKLAGMLEAVDRTVGT